MFIRRLFQRLPYRVQASIYRRFICPQRKHFQNWFDNAPLKFAPSIRMNLSPGDSFHGDIAFCGIYEPVETSVIHQLAVEKGGLLIDVGANYGYYSLLWCAARVGNRAKAIEASPRNVKALRENVARNNMGDRIEVHEWAASNHKGMVHFTFGSNDETGWGGITSVATEDSIRMDCRRLDEEVQEPVTLLKVDCEGSDAWVLEGAQGLLQQGLIENIVFEENVSRQHRLGITSGNIVEQLQAMRYTVQPLGCEAGNYLAVKNV